MREVAESTIPVVLYESPHRILKLLSELAIFAPACRVTIAREITKVHEEIVSGTPAEVALSLESRGAARGEFVVIVESSS